VVAIWLGLTAPTAQADVAVADTGLRLHIALHDVDGDRRPALERMTRDALEAVEDALVIRLGGDLHLDFVDSPEAFADVMRAHGVRGWQEAWIAGLSLLGQDRVIVQVGGPGALRTSETVRHELAHVAVHALSGGLWVPRWYHEGVAMWLAGEASFERLRELTGAAGFGHLDSLQALDRGFDPQGNQMAVERAYALAAGFVRFAVVRVGDRKALPQMHERMRLGLDFPAAFAATFGMAPDRLYSLYASHVGAAASSWTVALSDGLIWGVVSLLALGAMLRAWWHRPQFAPEPGEPDEPLDLEAIAEAGRSATLRPWHVRDFTKEPLLASGSTEDQRTDLEQPTETPTPSVDAPQPPRL
jgi:hypothetical protein